MSPKAVFYPCTPLVPGHASPRCRAIVTLPARNEEATLARCLDALASQVGLKGQALFADSYEILLLLNNCTDRSAAVARSWLTRHPHIVLHCMERTLPVEEAHVGTARRLLMDTAWLRLRAADSGTTAILSTDADTLVASDWIAQNTRALLEGADVVGGNVSVLSRDLEALPSFVRRCYQQDRRYAALVAQLEDLLDPREGDRCPRHLDHFGSSLACTPAAYEAAGGMPAVTPLEDEAFVDRARRANLRLRHDPLVQVYTSARLHGRAEMGLAGQLRLWDGLVSEAAHLVPSAAFLEHRFRTLHRLREIYDAKHVGDLVLPTDWWRSTFAEALQSEETYPGFLAAVYCDVLITESFLGVAQEPISAAIARMEAVLRSDAASQTSAELIYELTGTI